ncbi:hypothetical protein B0T20DRAFT_412263 [Sordaria brevicollis]|uniref:Uncharacterized protein n=1 Tax=Sordaria brevicollis TaxID=83679 RepID=A0AAE0PF68_SORBR|nr:hypothetical protein B0T20DRAFT_412263 [Sordaria brevicollis]
MRSTRKCQPFIEGFSKEQETLFRKRTQANNDTEKWRDMWMILFPEDRPESILSPCQRF